MISSAKCECFEVVAEFVTLAFSLYWWRRSFGQSHPQPTVKQAASEEMADFQREIAEAPEEAPDSPQGITAASQEVAGISHGGGSTLERVVTAS